MDLSTISFSSEEFVQESTLGSTTMPQDSSIYKSISQDKRPTADAHSETLAQESHVIQGLVTSRTFAGPSSTLTTDTPEQRPHSSVTSTTQNYLGDTLILTSADTEMNTFQGPPTMIMPSTSGIDVVNTGMDTFQTDSESTRIINVLTTMLLPTLMLDTSATLSFDRPLPPTSMHGSVLPNSDSVQVVSATATDIVTSYPSTIAHVSLLCSCPCWRQTLQGTKADILKQLDSILEEVRKNLTLDKDTLSATIRKRISAPDARKSATGVGAIGTGVVTFFFSLVVFGDIVSFVLGCVRWFGKTVNIKVGIAS
ncbi:uncharacterized protein LOC125377074 [Haliotis rufescens]|uniref:uncharacterized protein LOC125377074 n=1 Tax=Haliotis rufescens TaxID=6454 RepID=UPI00201E8D13|nr:uncharacterized protein LOC125377074 [Haliotis rufescens]